MQCIARLFMYRYTMYCEIIHATLCIRLIKYACNIIQCIVRLFMQHYAMYCINILCIIIQAIV